MDRRQQRYDEKREYAHEISLLREINDTANMQVDARRQVGRSQHSPTKVISRQRASR
jgi:hypothetical protein